MKHKLELTNEKGDYFVAVNHKVITEPSKIESYLERRKNVHFIYKDENIDTKFFVELAGKNRVNETYFLKNEIHFMFSTVPEELMKSIFSEILEDKEIFEGLTNNNIYDAKIIPIDGNEENCININVCLLKENPNFYLIEIY